MGSSYSSEEEAEAVMEDVSVPAREDGDGMEKPPEASINKPTIDDESVAVHTKVLEAVHEDVERINNKVSPPLKKIELPEAGLSLEKLPPIRDKVDLPGPPLPGPRSVVRENPKIYPRGSYPPAVKKKKEPKFVPYEPYKGAVAFMEKDKGKIKYMKIFKTSRKWLTVAIWLSWMTFMDDCHE